MTIPETFIHHANAVRDAAAAVDAARAARDATAEAIAITALDAAAKAREAFWRTVQKDNYAPRRRNFWS